MERFHFRLEKILRLRGKQEERYKRIFSRKKAELVRIEMEIGEVREKLSHFIQDNPRDQGIFTAFDMLAIDNYVHRIEKRIDELNHFRDEKKEEVDSAFRMLTEAKRAKKVFENLKNRKFERYMIELNREERNELDDVNQHIGINKEKLSIEDLPLEDM